MAFDDAHTVNEDETLDVAAPGVLTNDTDADLEALTASPLTGVSNGTLTLNADGSFTYTPDADFNGADSFTYNANDPSGAAAAATVTIAVAPINDRPVLDTNTGVTLDEGGTISVTGAELRVTDVDNTADEITFTLTAPPTNGDLRRAGIPLILNATFTQADVDDGSTISYQHDAGETTTDAFTFTASDPGGDTVGPATVSFSITPVNDRPELDTNTGVTLDEGGTISVTGAELRVTDVDNPADEITFTLTAPPTNGDLRRAGAPLILNGTFTQAELDDGSTISYQHDGGETTTDAFTFTASDPDGGPVGPATFSITVTPVNDDPVLDANVGVTLDEGGTISVTGNELRVTDVDNTADEITFTLTAPPTNGDLRRAGVPLILNATFTQAELDDGSTISYQHDGGETTTDGFTFTASDPGGGGGGGGIGPETFSITVRPVNDSPVAVDDAVSTPEDTPVTIDALANDTDADGDTLSITSISAPANGTAIPQGTGILFTPNADFSGADSFTYTISDGQVSATATVNEDVGAVNDIPVADDDVYAVNEDTTLDIPAPGVLTNDSDVDGDALTASLQAGPANGSLTLNLDGSFTYAPNVDFNGSDSFTYAANDPSGSAGTATVTITVTPVNDPPRAVDDSAVTSEDSPITINVLANDIDPERDPLTVTAADPPNGTTRVNPDRSVTYTPDPDFNGVDSFTYTISDGQGGTDTATVNVTVTAVNDNPDAVDDTLAVAEDSGAATVAVLTNDSDSDNDPLTITAVSDPTNGTVVVQPGFVLYTPDPDFNGLDSFTYTISDGQGGTDTATVNVTVTAVNDSPVAADDNVSTPEDTSVTIDVLVNDTDADGDTLTITLVSAPTNGTAAIQSGFVLYTPDPNFNGLDSLTYTITDGQASATANVNIDMTAVNDPPTASPDSATTDEDRPVTIDIVANDFDPDGDPLAPVTCTDPANGRIIINTANNAVYTPNPNFNGDDAAQCTVEDGRGGSATALVTIVVISVNDPPVAINNNYSVNEDETLTISAPGVLGNDSDVDGDALTAIMLSTIPPGASLTFNSDGSFVYKPPTDFNGSHSFAYVANDGVADSNNATFTIDVLPVNDAPTANPDSATTKEDRPVTVDIVTNDFDPDGDPLNVDTCSDPVFGRVVINTINNAVTYTPDPDFNGEDTCNCVITDGRGGSATALVTFKVTAVNDPPVGVPDNYIVDEDQDLTVLAPGVLANDTDVDGDPLAAVLVTDVADGSLALNVDGSFTYMPNPDFNGSDSFTYVPNDGTVDGNITTVTIRVNPVNDPPAATDDNASTAEDTSVTIDVLANDSDPDGDGLNITLVSNPANGDATIQGTGIAYMPDPNFNGTDSFTYDISDGNGGTDTATVNVTVNPVNDPPVAANDAAATAEDTAVTVEVLVNDSDPENDPITLDSVSNPSDGTASINPNGTILYTPNPNFNGTDSFTYTISDDQGGSATATVNVTVTAVNDPPIAGDDTAATAEGTAVVINVLGNDSDVDGDTLSLTAVTDPASGEATINTDGTVTYNPDSGFTGIDTFSYTAGDGSGFTTTANVTVTVIAGGIEVSIDIRPGNPNNRINLQSNGLLPVAIFSTPEFDATTIDPATVTLAGAAIRTLRNGRRLVLRVDRNRDGIRDLLAFFPIQELELTVQNQTAVLRGRTVDGTRIRGENSVQVSDGRVRLRNNVVWPSPLYSTLQDAVDAVRNGGTVRVLAGRHEINEPVIVEREVTLRGAGCGECQGRSGGGSGGRPRGRSTELVGPTPTTVVEADLAIGMFTYAGGGGGGGGIVGRGGGGGKITDIALHGFDASIVSLTTSRPLSVENVLMADTTRGILWMAPAPLSVDQVTVKGVLWNGISLVGDGEFDAPYHLSNTVTSVRLEVE